MNSVIISDYGVMLVRTGERLVIRGPKPRLELIEGGPQLFLPLGMNSKRPTLSVVTSDGLKTPPPPLPRSAPDGSGVKPPKKSADEIELPLFRVGKIVIGSPGVAISADMVEACCERGIGLSFLTRSGKPYAMLSSPMLTATVITRREQLAAYNVIRLPHAAVRHLGFKPIPDEEGTEITRRVQQRFARPWLQTDPTSIAVRGSKTIS